MEPSYAALPEPLPYQGSDCSIRSDKRDNWDKFIDGAIITWSLVIHCLGSIGIAIFVLWLDKQDFNIKREQEVPLVDGNTTSLNTPWYRAPLRVQPEVTTTISALLKLLGLVADAWAGALCWRVIMLLGERSRDGLNRGEINLIAKYGILPLKSHFRLSLNPILGVILMVTLAQNVASPILTGSVAWVPSSSVLPLEHPPTIPITGVDPTWGTDIESGVFKRVVPSTRHLNIGSTVKNVTMPYISITNITWLPLNVSTNLTSRFKSMMDDSQRFPQLSEQMSQSRAIALLTSTNATWEDAGPQGTQGAWPLLINVVGSYREYRENKSCDLNRTILANSNTRVPFQEGDDIWHVPGCFALANVSFIAGSRFCKSCRITSNFTVQNIAELEMREDSYVPVGHALNDMPVYLPSLAPLLGSFPDPMALNSNVDDYVKAFLVRSYSALWNAWTDAADPMISGYSTQSHSSASSWVGRPSSKRDVSSSLKSNPAS